MTSTAKIYSLNDFEKDCHEEKIKQEGIRLRALEEFRIKVEKLVQEFNERAKKSAKQSDFPNIQMVVENQEIAQELVSRISSGGWKTTTPRPYDELSMDHCKYTFYVTKPVTKL